MLTEEQKRENRMRYCSNPDFNCAGVCIGVTMREGWGEKTRCELYSKDTYNFMDFTFDSDRLGTHPPIIRLSTQRTNEEC